MKKYLNNKNIIIFVVGVILLVALILLFILMNSSKKNSLDMSKISYSGNTFDSSEKIVEELDTKEDCIFDLDVFSGKKICFDVLNNVEASVDSNFRINQSGQDIEVLARNNNVDNGIDELELINQDYKTFKDIGYFNRKYKIASTSLEDYLINVYSVVYRNRYSDYASKVFIFINNDSNHILLTYYSKNGQIGDKLINKLVKDISIKDNDQEYKTEEVNDNYSKYTIENSCFYKLEEVDGEKKFVFRTEEDADVRYALDIIFDAFEYQPTGDNEESNIVTFKQKDDNYILKIKLFSSDYDSRIRIIQYSYMGYENVNIKDDYKVDNKDFLKAEYVHDDKKYVDYYYLYDNGMYVSVSFEANMDYVFDYDEIEKLLEFDIYQL